MVPPGLLFCWLQYGVPHGHRPSRRTEWRALEEGSSLESLHSLHKCLNRVMPTLHLPRHRLHRQSTSCSITLWGGSSSQAVCCQLGYIWGLGFWALLQECPIIHQHLQMPIGNWWMSQLQAKSFCSLQFSWPNSRQWGLTHSLL